ncbi:hypothetical protein [Massilia sp. NP310]|uniref:hypothetical protein n=1 Tax=Massilia sp. NP310 TaxID=2861282 RepID=UPI001C62D589|nr:hypothetical protein [Massilia sp. NP310]QYG01896.1 hypothetical protein KY496_00060 [Massilia sp. NP310]
METLEKIILAIAIFVLTSIIAYLFRMRQLYVAIPKLYSHAPLSKNGTLSELIIYNRGNQVEEDIEVEIDQSIKLDLIASSSADVTLENSTLKIHRLHKNTEQSAVLLVEEGVLSPEKIKTISSKGVKGKVINKVRDVPYNYAAVFLLMLFLLSVFPAIHYGFKYSGELKNFWVEYRLPKLVETGWSGLAEYYDSDVSDSYKGAEFPLLLVDFKKNGATVVLTYKVLNKTALPMEVSSIKSRRNMLTEGEESPYFSNVDVAPLSAGKIQVRVPVSEIKNNLLNVDFFFQKYGRYDFVVSHKVKINT